MPAFCFVRANPEMKQITLTILSLCCIIFHVSAQKNADEIVGKWINVPHKTLVITVYKSGDSYAGKVLSSTVKDDAKPEGFVILDKLQFDSASGIWKNGKVHAANSNKLYNAEVSIKPDGNLEVHGFMGSMKFMGSRKNFMRVN